MIRITINGQMIQFSSKLHIDPTQWNVQTGKVIDRTASAVQLNNLLDEMKASIINHYRELERRDSYVTVEKLRNTFLGVDNKQDSLLEHFDKHNNGIRKLIGIDHSNSTYKKYNLARKRVYEYLQYKYRLSDIALKDLTLDFIREYEIFLKAECRLSNNVAAKMIQFLKKIVTLAFNDGIIRSNPFANFHIKLSKIDIGYLTKEELDIIIKLKVSGFFKSLFGANLFAQILSICETAKKNGQSPFFALAAVAANDAAE